MTLTPMMKIALTYITILTLAMLSYFTGIVYYANLAGFIGAMGIMYLFFKDRPEDWDENSAEALEDKRWRKMWYFVLGFGIFASLIFGSLWNHQFGGMA
ncbi:hypothetical protein [Thiomicrospira sp. ALE5]|uniref:hypothetical protein n=1 Tax=Thiomicrospira sp. ALE5 TaxID=748650 RepID=UPI0008E3CAED|nr:hypothetical protein [Thiomicrospira sp. ALE5]SFR51680.1 hypothetical protein SAMN03092900_0552 [Thiomicrospira sp. ALE5]